MRTEDQILNHKNNIRITSVSTKLVTDAVSCLPPLVLPFNYYITHGKYLILYETSITDF